jgi:hypothetical protein
MGDDDDLCSSDAVLDFDRYLLPLATNKTAVNAANTPAVIANMNGSSAMNPLSYCIK